MTGEPVDGKGEAQGRYKLMLMSIDHPDDIWVGFHAT